MSTYMGTIHTYEERGMDGEKWWFVASYPLGATRYYETENFRNKAIKEYCDHIAKTGGVVLIHNHRERSANAG